MTTVLAITFLVCYAFAFLPGSSFRHKHEVRDYAWDGPHVWVALVREAAALALATWLVFS